MSLLNCTAVRRERSILAFALVVFVLMGSTRCGNAQAQLGLRLTPTVSVTGPIGTWQQIQYSDDLADPTNWTFLSNVLLDNSTKVYFDTSGLGLKRFYRSVQLTNVADTNLVWIPPGTFLMGSPSNEIARSNNEGPQTLVTFTRVFFMGRFLVTELEYLSVVGTNPSQWANALTHLSFPITGDSWFDAGNYCAMLTERDRLAFRIPPDYAYRLPAEAEWEYACRAGTTTVFNFGNVIYANTNLGSLANFDGRHPYPPIPTDDPTGIHLAQPTAVGSYAPNAFGLYDMHGNVLEWCQDLATSSITLPAYPGGTVTNPVPSSPAGAGLAIVRGGSYSLEGVQCRSAARLIKPTLAAASFYTGTGFRVVLAPTNAP